MNMNVGCRIRKNINKTFLYCLCRLQSFENDVKEAAGVALGVTEDIVEVIELYLEDDKISILG